LKREQIFLTLLALVGLTLLSACKEGSPVPVTVPENVSRITVPFITTIKQGEFTKSEEYLSTSYKNLPKIRFTQAQKILAAAPDLKPIYFQKKPKALMGPKDNEFIVVYATQHKRRWKSLQIRLFGLDGEPLEIEQWNARNEVEPPPELRAAALMKNTLLYGGVFMAALIAVFIAGLIWFFRRRRRDVVADERRVATVVQG
jgi:hypothetical protein